MMYTISSLNGCIPENTYSNCFDYSPLLVQEAYDDLGLYIPHSEFSQSPKSHNVSSSSSVSTSDSVSSTYSRPYNYIHDYTTNFANRLSMTYSDHTHPSEGNHIYMSCRMLEPDHGQQNTAVYKSSLLARFNQSYIQHDTYYDTLYGNFFSGINKDHIKKETYVIPDSPLSDLSDISSRSSSINSTVLSSQSPDAIKKDDAPTKKMHSCDFCSRKFARKYDVNRHTRIHTGKKPYVCSCCHKCFARSDALNRHIRKEVTCFTFSEKLETTKRAKYFGK
ncbi:hypothetical protein G6F57_014204 [Rhizopus arrhizus]|nr:hypothetical protein G6F30_008944 [Rhizopus arrhizus]KAG1395859.1 hypothetical protein G6F58_011853 [Rhizopus delemar]KAG0973773.1 hypothetical protein G6F29_012641 [Rhizopus arrhizus]KAG0979661.1 hypothetical protein G6F28_011838 [Rhizopus arrhizus]KAG1001676.1 hypothetical protein G6F27_012652 [Rhizopus arrhizus]